MASTRLCQHCRDFQLNSALDQLDDGDLKDLLRIPHVEFFSSASSCDICDVTGKCFLENSCPETGATKNEQPVIIVSIRKHGKNRRLIYFNTLGWGMVNWMVWNSQNPLIDPSPISDKSFSRVQDWIHRCDQDHKRCKKPEPRFMPTRLLDIGAVSFGTVRLVLSADPEDRYIALSHCWGEQKTLITTSKNLSSFQLEIPTSSLPKTFADAVKVTQLLGMRYLWIDSLCIIQDDSQDWLRESATMASVYGNADITIVASRASSSAEGFLSPRRETCVVKKETDTSGQEINLHLVNRNYYDNYMSSVANSHPEPLAKRAWVIQERHLSRRKILFGEAQLFWECNETTESEDTQLAILHDEDELSWISPSWYDIVEKFTKCDITYESDTLPAISGIARIVADKTGHTYCAGIWLNQLCNSLLWYPEQNGPDVSTKVKRKTYVAPSFSWAASQGPVYYRALSKGIMSGRLCNYVAHDQTLRAGSSDPCGGLEDAWIQLKSPLIKVLHQMEGIGSAIRLMLQLQSGKKYVIPAVLDHDEAGIPADTFILLMYHDETRMQGLVLAHTPVRQDCMAFRRIGISWIPSNQLQKVNWWGSIVDINYAEREEEMGQFVRQSKQQIQTVMLI